MEKDIESKPNKDQSLFEKLLIPNLLFKAFALVTIFLIGLFVFVHLSFSTAKAGQFGDSFGIFTSLFSGITVIGLLITIHFQREDLKIAREAFSKQAEELELTRDQIKQSNKEFNQQNETLKVQRFESTFFSMLALHKETANKIQFMPLVELCRTQIPSNPQYSAISIDSLRNSYRLNCQSIIRVNLGQYIRHYQRIIELIFHFSFEPAIRYKYLNILFGQLSQDELEIICYHFTLKDTMWPEFYREYIGQLFSNINIRRDNINIIDHIKVNSNIIVPYDTLLVSYTV